MYTIADVNIPPRGAHLNYNELGPGLYHGEMVINKDDYLIAVSVERHWLENGSGISFHGYARWIEPNGQTLLAPNGSHIESSFSFTANPTTLEEHGSDAIATDVARVVLGEPVELANADAPVLFLAEEILLNASIIRQINAASASASSAIQL